MNEELAFFDYNPTLIQKELLDLTSQYAGRTITPTDSEYLVVNAVAEIIVRHVQKMQFAASQMMVRYASGGFLDAIGELVRVVRLPASFAKVTLQFSLSPGHPGTIIPAGTLVKTTDGKFFFAVDYDVVVNAGTNTITESATAIEYGSGGNGYIPGAVSVITDPVPFVFSVTNTTVSGGGADIESDEEMRERIILAPDSFSTAGSTAAYKFWAKSASSAIIDVAIPVAVNGLVRVFPLVDGVATPQPVLDAVAAVLNREDVIPVSDTVEVISPTFVDYSISVQATVYDNYSPSAVAGEINSRLNAFKDKTANKMGRDVVVSQISSVASDEEKVYNVTVVSPANNIVVAANEVARVTGITVTIQGTNEG